MSKPLPLLTTMMLDALKGTLRIHEKTRAATVCRCVFQVYTMTHGYRPPWEVMGTNAENAAKQAESQPVTIIDTTAEVISEETRIYDTDRKGRGRQVDVQNVRRQRAISRTNGKRVRTSNNTG